MFAKRVSVVIGDLKSTRFDKVTQIINKVRKECTFAEFQRYAGLLEKCPNYHCISYMFIWFFEKITILSR